MMPFPVIAPQPLLQRPFASEKSQLIDIIELSIAIVCSSLRYLAIVLSTKLRE